MRAESLSVKKSMAASRYGAGLSVIRLTITGAVSLASLFVLCWAGAVATDVRLSHMFIELFTMAPIGSVTALAEGACWSFLFGALSGLLISFTYNLLSFLDTEGEAS